MSEIEAQLYALLLPLKGTGEPYYDDDEYPDMIGPDDPIRNALSKVLACLEVSGQSGCPLCCS